MAERPTVSHLTGFSFQLKSGRTSAPRLPQTVQVNLPSAWIPRAFVETRPVRWFGMIVQPDSADVGLPSAPIPVDADHFEIASSPSRTSDVYVHVRDQLRKPVRSRKTVIADVNVLQGAV
jgi:hypothetical protein